MKTRIIHTKIWEDSFFLSLNRAHKLLFIYFLANSKTNMLHCYECADKVILFETQCSVEELEDFKTQVEAAGKIYFFQDYVLLKNGEKYCTYKNTWHRVTKSKLAQQLPDPVRDWAEQYISLEFMPMDSPIKQNNKYKNTNPKIEEQNKKHNHKEEVSTNMDEISVDDPEFDDFPWNINANV